MTLFSLRAAATMAGLAFAVAASAQAPVKKKPKPKAPAAPRALKVELEQDGKPVPIRDHEAILSRAPFTLIVTLPDMQPVFLSASFADTTYETARSGQPFGKADFRSGIGGAEGKANEGRDLFVRTPGDDVIHMWDCEAGEYRRFDQLVVQSDGCRGSRTVENVFLGEDVPLGKVLRRPLHLVFLRGTLGDEGVEKEASRDWLKLHLGTVPAATGDAVKSQMETLFDSGKPVSDREASLQALASMGREAVLALDAVSYAAATRAREAGAVADLRTVLSAEMAYASLNGGLYDGPPCLLEPGKCLKKFSGAPFLQLVTLETRNGYKKLFLPGPPASKDEIKRAKASPSSLKDFIVVAWPEIYGETGERSFCADSTGRVCSVPGADPPAKGGRCTPDCATLP